MSDSLECERGAEHSQAPRVRLVRSDRGDPFPEYRLMGLVGQGQFAQVYCAIHRQTEQLAAIKQTRHAPEHPSQEPFVLGELCHKNVVCCQAIAQTKVGYQFVLDYCEAGTLRSYIDACIDTSARSALLLPLQIVKIASDILSGLSYIHSEQVIHGDLKPENILLTYQLQPTQLTTDQKQSQLTARIGDFGSARFVDRPNQTRREIGSPTYAAPERFRGQSSYASDIYSAGVILYELLLGDRPFSGSPDYLRRAHQSQPIPFLKSIPAAVQQFLEQALHKLPARRFVSANDMLNAFQALIDCGAIAALSQRFNSSPSDNSKLDDDQLLYKEQISREQISRERAFREQIPSSLSIAKLPGIVQQLFTVNQTCFTKTDSAVYWLDSQKDLHSIVQLNQPSQIALAPDGRWLVILPDKYAQTGIKALGQFVSLRTLADTSSSGTTTDLAMDFDVQLLDLPQTKPIAAIAVDRRHIVRILASTQTEKSYLSCFTREGKRLVDLSLNVSLSQAALSLEPYQIVATAETSVAKGTQILLVSLRPFQVRSLLVSSTDLCSHPKDICAFPWGFSIVDEKGCLFLDRLARSVGRLDLDGVNAIASLPDNKALVAIARQPGSTDTAQSTSLAGESSQKETAFSEKMSTLLTIDLKDLDLDLVF